MCDCYRARATKAEQECARLRRELERRPKFKWFVDQIKTMLGFSSDSSNNEVIQRIKVLRDNQAIYKAGAPERKDKATELRKSFDAGVVEGRRQAFDEVVARIKTKAP